MYKRQDSTIAYKSLICRKLNNTILYDNSINAEFNNSYSSYEGYIWDSNNSGLSAAYNFAAKYAQNKGYKWLLISDQDTYFPNNAVEAYEHAIKTNPDIKLFLPKVVTANGKIMSPVKSTHYFSRLSHHSPSGIINPEKYAIINSGLCINVEAFFEVGKYNEKVWLDFADIQFIERFAKKYKDAYVIDLECTQSFSNEGQNINQKINRFKSFCDSIRHYEPNNRLNKFWIFCVTLKRALSLSKQSKSIEPLSIFVKYYLL